MRDKESEGLTAMVKSPYQWYMRKEFREAGIPDETCLAMRQDSHHLMRIYERKFSFLGGYILGYSLRENPESEQVIEAMPFQFRYIEPLKFAQIMEISPDMIPETYDTPKGKRKTVERVQFNGSLLYRIPAVALACMSLPVVEQKPYNKMPLNDLAYKYRLTGNEKFLENFLDRVKGEVGLIVNRYFDLQKQIYGRELLIALGLEGAKEAFCRYDFSQNVQVRTFMQKRVRGCILDYLREEDSVSRLVRQIGPEVEEIIEKAAQEGKEATLEQIYKHFPEKSRETVEQAYKIATGRLKEVSLQKDVGKKSSSKHIALREITEDEHPVFKADPAEILGDKEILELILKKMEPHEREMIVQYFLEQRTMKEIGKSIDLSESRVSQLFPDVLKRVRAEARKYDYLYD